MNRHIATVLIAPMTTKGQRYPSRVLCRFQDKDGQVVLDQIRTVDKRRLVKRIGSVRGKTSEAILNALVEMFTP